MGHGEQSDASGNDSTIHLVFDVDRHSRRTLILRSRRKKEEKKKRSKKSTQSQWRQAQTSVLPVRVHSGGGLTRMAYLGFQ